jgi:prophage maintenance system killer protein/predicted XRE-type DNA-binding protein
MDENTLAIYQADSGAIELPIDATHETIWATQKQIAEVFGVDRSRITRHINNILADGEVDKKSNVRKAHIANSDRPVSLYSMDIILAVGYRTNSARAIHFRKWATKTLRQYITDGYAINPERIKHNNQRFLHAVNELKLLSGTVDAISADKSLDLVQGFASTWLSLQSYDEDNLPNGGTIKQAVDLSSDELATELQKLKANLIEAGEATELFAAERDHGGHKSLFRNVFQSFAGEDVYPTVEEKAAHLLYFVVKNHVFTDGNKRSGAYSFVWFLQKVGILNIHEISPQALTAITLLVAESKPSDKQRIIGLILLLLGVSNTQKQA